MIGKKIVATSVPLFSIHSRFQKLQDYGTIQSGSYFIDWIKKAGLNGWQMLPLSETQLENGSATVHVPSPYKGYGVGIDPRYLSGKNSNIQVRSSKQGQNKNSQNFKARDLQGFIFENRDWIEDYGIFCALRDHFGTDDWREWDDGLSTRDKKVLENWRRKLTSKIDEHIFRQFLLHKDYEVLRKKARKLGITLIGDLPFYISLKSPLVWANQDAFVLGKNKKMDVVSGIPDSSTSLFGRQIWGHPVYDWENKKKVLKLWEIRVNYCSKLFDLLRIDYAKGLFIYGVINIKNEKKDKFIKAPGENVFREIIKICEKNDVKIFAEDLGSKTEQLNKFLKKTKIAGVKVLRFAYDRKRKKVIAKYANTKSYPKNSVAYTTVHDAETLIGYLKILKISEKQRFASAVGVDYSSDDYEMAISLRKKIIESNASTIIVPIQDWLLTSDRINVPGTEKEIGDRNWRYELKIPIEKLPTDLL